MDRRSDVARLLRQEGVLDRRAHPELSGTVDRLLHPQMVVAAMRAELAR